MTRPAMRPSDVTDHAAVQALARGFTRGSLTDAKRWLLVQWNRSEKTRVLYRVLEAAPGGDRYVYALPTCKLAICYSEQRARIITVTENTPAAYSEMREQEARGELPHHETWQAWYQPGGRHIVTPQTLAVHPHYHTEL